MTKRTEKAKPKAAPKKDRAWFERKVVELKTEEVKALGVPGAILLAQRIAKADVQEARRLIWKSKYTYS